MRLAFDDLVAIMARLRGPGGCPWDREQTHATLAPYLLEEAHEVLDAISRGDPGALREELGDLLLQVVFHAQMAREAGGFDVGAVVDGLARKLIDRHPHVFGEVRLGTPGEVLTQWHELKRRETPARGPFEGIPASLPALARAQKLLGRAVTAAPAGEREATPIEAAGEARRYLDRLAPRPEEEPGAGGAPEAGPGTSVASEARPGPALTPEALGDLLFAAVALAEAAGLDAESALREASERFVAAYPAGGPSGGVPGVTR